jgi:DNA-binding MarR family transcriptional regulator
MNKTIDIIFGSKVRGSILQLLFKNKEREFTQQEIIEKTKLKTSVVKNELKILSGIDLVNSQVKKRQRYYFVNRNFIFYREILNIIEKSQFNPDKKLVSQIKKIGNVKFAIIAGTLINHQKAEADLLIVGENIDQNKLLKLVEDLEAETGQEIHYAVMDSDEFNYRRDMFDRFTLELLKSPHRELINRLPSTPKRKVEQ